MNFVLETHVEVGTGAQAEDKVRALMEGMSEVLKDLGLANPSGDADSAVSFLVLKPVQNRELEGNEWMRATMEDAIAFGVPIDGSA